MDPRETWIAPSLSKSLSSRPTTSRRTELTRDDERARDYWERAVALDPESDSGRLAARGLTKLSATGVPALAVSP